jgi:ABC-type nitrate/sulfonate/bicarbonate transport system substrate-binding protein
MDGVETESVAGLGVSLRSDASAEKFQVTGAQSGAYVAQEEGLFKKHGLEMELIHIASSSRGIQAILAGGAPSQGGQHPRYALLVRA